VTRIQFFLALMLAAVVGFGLGFLVRGGELHSAAERFRDTAAALKKIYQERVGTGTPHQQVLARPRLGRTPTR
jgi:hypothetical protein